MFKLIVKLNMLLILQFQTWSYLIVAIDAFMGASPIVVGTAIGVFTGVIVSWQNSSWNQRNKSGQHQF